MWRTGLWGVSGVCINVENYGSSMLELYGRIGIKNCIYLHQISSFLGCQQSQDTKNNRRVCWVSVYLHIFINVFSSRPFAISWFFLKKYFRIHEKFTIHSDLGKAASWKRLTTEFLNASLPGVQKTKVSHQVCALLRAVFLFSMLCFFSAVRLSSARHLFQTSPGWSKLAITSDLLWSEQRALVHSSHLVFVAVMKSAVGVAYSTALLPQTFQIAPATSQMSGALRSPLGAMICYKNSQNFEVW